MLTVTTSLVRSATSAITALVVGEGDRLAADREVAPLRPADVVVGHQDPGQVRVAAEDDPEEVEDFALLRLGGGEEVDAGVDRREGSTRGSCPRFGPTIPRNWRGMVPQIGATRGRDVFQHRFYADALDPVAV